MRAGRAPSPSGTLCAIIAGLEPWVPTSAICSSSPANLPRYVTRRSLPKIGIAAVMVKFSGTPLLLSIE